MSEAVFGLAGVIIGASLPWVKDWWMERGQRDRKARYLAIRVVCVLDAYVEKCFSVICDDGLSQGQRNAKGCLEPQVALPEAPAYPDDLDWQSINYDLMYRILSLPSAAQAADRQIAYAWEYSDPPDYDEAFEERQYLYACVGVSAVEITEKLRKTYAIAKPAYGQWDYDGRLRKTKDEIDNIRADRKLHPAVDWEAAA